MIEKEEEEVSIFISIEMPFELSAGKTCSIDFLFKLHRTIFRRSGSIPAIYRDLFEMLNVHGIEKLNSSKFESLFERQTLTKSVLSQVNSSIINKWRFSSLSQILNSTGKGNAFLTRTDFYKSLAFMALVQQGKSIDEKLLDNFVNRGERKEKHSVLLPESKRKAIGAIFFSSNKEIFYRLNAPISMQFDLWVEQNF